MVVFPVWKLIMVVFPVQKILWTFFLSRNGLWAFFLSRNGLRAFFLSRKRLYSFFLLQYFLIMDVFPVQFFLWSDFLFLVLDVFPVLHFFNFFKIYGRFSASPKWTFSKFQLPKNPIFIYLLKRGNFFLTLALKQHVFHNQCVENDLNCFNRIEVQS